jgi:hypothetical protein
VTEAPVYMEAEGDASHQRRGEPGNSSYCASPSSQPVQLTSHTMVTGEEGIAASKSGGFHVFASKIMSSVQVRHHVVRDSVVLYASSSPSKRA